MYLLVKIIKTSNRLFTSYHPLSNMGNSSCLTKPLKILPHFFNRTLIITIFRTWILGNPTCLTKPLLILSQSFNRTLSNHPFSNITLPGNRTYITQPLMTLPHSLNRILKIIIAWLYWAPQPISHNPSRPFLTLSIEVSKLTTISILRHWGYPIFHIQL